MKVARYMLLTINAIVWGAVVWSGWQGIADIRSQHAAGYPNDGQIHYYVLLPIVVLVASILPPLLLWRTRWVNYGTGWLLFTLLLLLPYGCFYTGRV